MLSIISLLEEITDLGYYDIFWKQVGSEFAEHWK